MLAARFLAAPQRAARAAAAGTRRKSLGRPAALNSATPGLADDHSEASPSGRYALEVPRTWPPPEQSRLDAYVASRLEFTSRGKVAAAIKDGLVSVNGRPVTKISYVVRPGDLLELSLRAPTPMEALPEALPLVTVYEDDHLLVVNKAPGMVVHPSVGHAGGTLVNAILHHCSLPAMRVSSGSSPPRALFPPAPASPLSSPAAAAALSEPEDDDGPDQDDAGGDDEGEGLGFRLGAAAAAGPAVLRPGIVHRIDKGTSGLLVVAKTERAHAGLCAQFAARTVQRSYLSITLGVPAPAAGRVEAPIGRDGRDRKRMAVVWAPGAGAKSAASRYRVVERLMGGGAALVEWRLETGRTHQIRVHARHMGHSLLGDGDYGGGGQAAVAAALARGGKGDRVAAAAIAAALPEERPMLHAQQLGFVHPVTGEPLSFEAAPPEDFAAILGALRAQADGGAR